jgi:uncharacterized protein
VNDDTRSAAGADRAVVTTAFGVLLALSVLGAQPITDIPNPRTRDATWVTDVAGGLRPDTIARLNEIIGQLERTTGAELGVAVVRSLDGLSVEEAAETVFRTWGIGKAGKDNGVLLLWSTGDRKVRIEVGYGLEGDLPDGRAGAILDTYVMPRFKAGEFDEGVIGGVTAIASLVGGSAPVELPSPLSESYEGDGGGFSFTSPTMLGVYGTVPAGLASFIGFRKWQRRRRRRCPQCGTWMLRLGESEDDAALKGGEQAEERVGSVDHDVWKCPSCSHQLTLAYPKWFTSYDRCPQCHNRTKSCTQTTVVAATTSSSGTARVNETCEFCTYRHEYTKTLPRIQTSSSSSGGSRSGGSSFGGGRSGGGGASRGY